MPPIKLIRKFYTTLIVIIIFFFYKLLFASDVDIKFNRVSSTVMPCCILQDIHGLIWIGTQEGLLRYDGYEFIRYLQIPFDSTSLSNNWIRDMKQDKNGNLWIGTRGGGLNYFNQKDHHRQ